MRKLYSSYPFSAVFIFAFMIASWLLGDKFSSERLVVGTGIQFGNDTAKLAVGKIAVRFFEWKIFRNCLPYSPKEMTGTIFVRNISIIGLKNESKWI